MGMQGVCRVGAGGVQGYAQWVPEVCAEVHRWHVQGCVQRALQGGKEDS